MGFFNKKAKERSRQRQLLELEVEKQGVLAVASRLDTAEDQKAFINDYWSGKADYFNTENGGITDEE